jgi:hypothetical protein
MAEPKTFTLRVRLSETQRERLQRIADEHFGGSLSDAVRQAITDAEVLRLARQDYFALLSELGPFMPVHENGETTFVQTALSPYAQFSDDDPPWIQP